MITNLNIPQDKMLTMSILCNNTKEFKSPPITNNINISSLQVYNYILRKLEDAEDLEEAYKILLKIKTMIRCVWRTMFTYSEKPDYNYFNMINNYRFSLLIKPYMKPVKMLIRRNSKEFNSEELLIIERCLIPSYDYSISQFTDDLWDKYLMIFDNILLSENIEVRRDLKIARDKQYKELAEEIPDRDSQEYKEAFAEITRVYRENIENNKEIRIFNIVNYLNYLWYNGTEEEKNLALSTVLLRYSSLTHDTDFNEIYHQDKETYKQVIASYLRQNNLFKLYLVLNIYTYQFLDKNIVSYDTRYIETMVKYTLGNLPSFEEYINSLFEDVIGNGEIIKLLLDGENIIKRLLPKYFVKFVFKTSSIYRFLKENVSEDLIKKYNLDTIYNNLSVGRNIILIFNKLREDNKQENYLLLDGYNINDVMREGVKCLCSVYGPFSYLILEYLLIKLPVEHINIMFKNVVQRTNKELLGLLTAYLNDITFYKMSINKPDTLTEITKYKISKELREELLIDIEEEMKEAKGYNKFVYETAKDKLL